MIALKSDPQARDAAFEQTQKWAFVRVTRLIPICCGEPMLQTGGDAGRKRYYRCPICQTKGVGKTTRERLT